MERRGAMMKLYYRFSEENQPLLEIRTDVGSPDGRTVAGRPYLHFHSLENGVVRTRLKSLSAMNAEEACAFVEEFQPYLIEISGTAEAVSQIHEWFRLSGFDVRANRGRAWQGDGMWFCGDLRTMRRGLPESEPPVPAPAPGVSPAPAPGVSPAPTPVGEEAQVVAEGGAA